MNALTKFSIALALFIATAIAAYLLVLDDGGIDRARPQPQDEICKQDGERLAQLRAHPSLDEGLRFVGEIRCLQLWPQLQTILDGLSDPSRSNAVSSLNGAAADTRSNSDAAPAPAASEPRSAAFDDACKNDEDRLAELRAKPSVDAVVLFESELRCPRLQPQVLALLDTLSQAPQSKEASDPKGKPPDTNSAGEIAQSRSAPAAEAASASPNDASDLARPPDAGGVSKDIAVETNTTKGAPEAGGPPAAPVASTASETDKDLRGAAEREENPPAAETDGLKPRVDSTLPGRQSESSASAPAVAVAERSGSEPTAQAIVDAERRIAALESKEEALAAEVRRLQRDREAPAAQLDTPTQQPTAPAAPSEARPASQAPADADRSGAALESDKDAPAAEVSPLPHDHESPTQTKSGPAAVNEPSDSEPSAALASLPDDMPARVLIRYPRNSEDARQEAERLADALRKQGVEVADLRGSDGVVQTGVTFFYAPDAAIAQRIGGLVGVAPTRRPQMKDGLMARPGAIELSVSGDSRLTVTTRSNVHE